jgi:hypothetical protein
MAQTGRVRIRVTDAAGAVVPAAVASLLGTDDKPTRTAQANGVGEIVFTDLPFGDCRFAVVASGFRKRPLTVMLRNGDEVRIEAVLEIANLGEVVMVGKRRRRWLFFR